MVEGLDIRSDMADIYAMMGVCPQHDLLWDTLTGREHLLFYGRLKNLKVHTLLSQKSSLHTRLNSPQMCAVRLYKLLSKDIGICPAAVSHRAE